MPAFDALPYPLRLLILAAIVSGISVVLGLISGWLPLAKRYRGRLSQVKSSHYLAWGCVGVLPLKHMMNLHVGPDGVGMTAFPLLALGFPALAVPWEAIDVYKVSDDTDGIHAWISFRIGGGVPVSVRGNAAEMLIGAWERWGVIHHHPEPDDEPRVTPDEPAWEIVDDPADDPHQRVIAPAPLRSPIIVTQRDPEPELAAADSVDEPAARMLPERDPHHRAFASPSPRKPIIETAAGPIRIEQRRD